MKVQTGFMVVGLSTSLCEEINRVVDELIKRLIKIAGNPRRGNVLKLMDSPQDKRGNQSFSGIYNELDIGEFP